MRVVFYPNPSFNLPTALFPIHLLFLLVLMTLFISDIYQTFKGLRKHLYWQ